MQSLYNIWSDSTILKFEISFLSSVFKLEYTKIYIYMYLHVILIDSYKQTCLSTQLTGQELLAQTVSLLICYDAL